MALLFIIKVSLILACSISLLPILIESELWNYDDIAAWGAVSAVCRDGTEQSPIALSMEDAYFSRDLASRPLTFKNYDGEGGGSAMVDGVLVNSGHSAMWTLRTRAVPVADRPSISGSLLLETYALAQLHFHWGSESEGDTCFGSEHLVEYRPAPLELHFVHFNTKYANLKEALKMRDGLAVIGVIFSAASLSPNEITSDLSEITSQLSLIKMPHEEVNVSISMAKLLPAAFRNNNKGSVYFRYEGSLTTPPCSEIATWTVYRDRLSVPIEQLRAFRTSLMTNATASGALAPLVNNYRPIQRHNDRPVWTNSELGRSKAAGSTMRMAAPIKGRLGGSSAGLTSAVMAFSLLSVQQFFLGFAGRLPA